MDISTDVVLERLAPRLSAIAWRVKDAAAGYGPEDAFQDMALSLVEKGVQEPAFLEQTDSFILSRCSWDGRNKAQSGRTYSKFNEPEDIGFELLSDRSAGPEDEAETRELMAGLKNAIERLGVKDREIIALLVIDCSPADIARKLGVSRSAISQRLQRIRTTLAGALVERN